MWIRVFNLGFFLAILLFFFDLSDESNQIYLLLISFSSGFALFLMFVPVPIRICLAPYCSSSFFFLRVSCVNIRILNLIMFKAGSALHTKCLLIPARKLHLFFGVILGL